MSAYAIERYQNQELVHIGDAGSFLLLAPAHGGRLVRWVHRGADILHWPADADWTRAARVRGGNPLLFPFIGRHFVDGEAGKWRAPDDPAGACRAMTQHGFARDLPFAVTQCEPDAAITMSLRPTDATRAAYPFDFAFDVTYRLLADGLEATLTTANLGAGRMPYYAGHHFYFALAHEARAGASLSMPRAELVRQGNDGILHSLGPGDARYALTDPRLQDTFHVQGTGPCLLSMPPNPAAPAGRALAISLDRDGGVPWHAVTTWTESETSDFYCVEPWLGLPNAIHNGQGLRWLEAGRSERATCVVRVVA